MMNKAFLSISTLLCAVLLTSCSLLKVAVSTGDPMSKSDVTTRLMTRGFYYDFASEVERAADSIVVASAQPAVKIAALRWKIRATRAGVSAAMQGIPDVALADLWILCRRMNSAFAELPDSALFGAQSPIARDAAQRLDRRVVRLAQQVLPKDRYELMTRFVTTYVAANPAVQGGSADNTTLAWLEYLRENGVEHGYATGSIAEVLADVNDRVSGQTQQLSNSIGWSKEMLQLEFRQDSLRSQLTAQLDSLDRNFTRMVTVAEHLPQLSDAVLEGLNKQATALIYRMNTSVNQAFDQLDRQRDELQLFVSRERVALVQDLRTSAQELLHTALDAAPALIGKLLLYLVLALVVLIGGPFALGFWLGGVRTKLKFKSKKE